MARKNLTVASVERVRPPKSGRVEMLDAIVPGLALRVTSKGGKTWAVRYRIDGKQRRMTLGPFPRIELDRAREKARDALELVDKGIDPAEELKVAKERQTAQRRASVTDPEGDAYEAGTFGAVVLQFINRVQSDKRRGWEFERIVRREILPDWGHRPITEITKRDINTVLDGLVDAGKPAAANRLHAIIRRIFNWAIGRGEILNSPCVGLEAPAPAAKKSRDRVLSDDEIRAMWEASGKMGWPFGQFFRLLLLTGQRREEVAGMERSELNLDEAKWTIPAERVKMDREHDVPLSATAIEILDDLPEFDKKLVFTSGPRGKKKANPISGWSRSKRRLDELMLEILRKEAEDRGDDPENIEIANWRLHDLRRTFATGLAKLNVPLHITSAALNHAPSTLMGVTAIYNRHAYFEERRHAHDAWDAYLRQLTGGKPDDKVVALHG